MTVLDSDITFFEQNIQIMTVSLTSQ